MSRTASQTTPLITFSPTFRIFDEMKPFDVDKNEASVTSSRRKLFLGSHEDEVENKNLELTGYLYLQKYFPNIILIQTSCIYMIYFQKIANLSDVHFT